MSERDEEQMVEGARAAAELERWLGRRYGLVEPTVMAWEERAAADLVRVEAGGEGYWLRICSRARVVIEELEEEGAVTAALAREIDVAEAMPKVRVAEAMPTIEGGYVAMWSGSGAACPALLVREVRGACVEAPSVEQAGNLGALVGMVHVAGSRRGRGARRVEPGGQAVRGLEHAAVHLRACGIDDEEVREIAAKMCGGLERAPLPGGFVHGDLHLENVRFDGDRAALFDFAWCGDGPFAYDLACYWRKRLLAQEGDAPPADWSAFVEGYAAARARAAEELAAVPALGAEELAAVPALGAEELAAVPALGAEELAAVPALACLRAIWVMCLPALPSEGWRGEWLRDPDYFGAHLAMIRRFARLAVSARAGRA